MGVRAIGVVLLPALWNCAGPPGQGEGVQACEPTVSGDLRLHRLDSRIFGNTRTIRVLLPPGYAADGNSRRYPVLYLLDGQNVFDACLSPYSHVEWGADETVYRLIAEGRIPPMIVVGVDHAEQRRAHEYLPYADPLGSPDLAEPAGRRLPAFLIDEVMPAVDAHFRTAPGRASTGIGGSSYGGVAALHVLLARPDRFGYGLIESPTLWVGDGQLVRDADGVASVPIRVHFGLGGREGEEGESETIAGLIRDLEGALRRAGSAGDSIRVTFDPEGIHSEVAWAARLPGALEFLFGDWQEPSRPGT